MAASVRICPGKHFAEQSLFLIVSNVLHTLNISAPLGEDGKTVRMESRMTEELFRKYLDIVVGALSRGRG